MLTNTARPGRDKEVTGPHPAEWDGTAIRRLWDWYAQDPQTRNLYFSRTKGRALASFISASGRLNGNFLDYGCGQGDFLAYLLDRPLSCYGADYSPQSVAKVSGRFRGHPNWRECRLIDGYRTDFPDGFFDVITLVETLEHIPDGWLTPLLTELRRLVKPAGLVIITTPHAEELGREAVYCPFCEAVFHRWQHMRSFSISALQELAVAHGFHSLFCRNIDLDQLELDAVLPPIRHVSPAKLARWVLRKVRTGMDFLMPRPFPDSRTIRRCLVAGDRRHLCALLEPGPQPGTISQPAPGSVS